MAIEDNKNLQLLWDRLIKEGCTKQGAAGLIGNLYSESRCNPTCVEGLLLQRYKEDGYYNFPYGLYDQKNYDLYVSRIDTGEISEKEFFSPRSYTGFTYQYGFGLAQWTSKGRKQGLWGYTKGKGKSISDLQGQVEFLVYELKNSYPSVWSIVSTTSSVNSASDIVLTHFEQPANAESYIPTRRDYSNQIYNLYKNREIQGGNIVSINFNNYYNKISNSGCDERGQYTGGAAGDQTGSEWGIVNWYPYPWKCVLRHPDPVVRELIAELAIQAANNNNIGYDQAQRGTFWEQLKAVGYYPANIKVKCESDCSAGVIALTKATGYLLGIAALKNISASYTGNMRSGFAAVGFQVLTASKYLNSSAYLVPGDILLNDNNHTAINLGIGSSSGYKSPKIKYNTSSYTNKEVQNMLKTAGWTDLKVDGDYGSKTITAVREFQTLYELKADGITGKDTAKVLKAVYDIVKKDGFDYKYYSSANPDLKKAFGTDLKKLLHHYYKYGKKEKRAIKKDSTVSPSTKASTPATTASKPASNELKYNTTGTYSKTPKKKGIVNIGLLNVRKGPGTNYANFPSYPRLAQGNEVDICDMVKGTDGAKWYYIRIAKKYYAFVSGKFLTVKDY